MSDLRNWFNRTFGRKNPSNLPPLLKVETTVTKDSGHCECCKNNSRCVWGLIHAPEGTIATYFVHWTQRRVWDHGANFDLIIGKWGDKATAEDRYLVSLSYRMFENGPQFMVIDAGDRPAATSELVGRALSRDEVLGKPIAKQAFDAVDAILEQDSRVLELLKRF